MMKFRFIRTEDPEYTKELMLRWEVLRKPLGMPPGSEIFPEEKESIHLVAMEGKKVVGCVLFHPETQEGGRLYHMAVSEEYHGRGFGRQLISTLEHALARKGFKDIHLYARCEAVSFYEQMGYTPIGEVVERTGIPHQLMQKTLALAA
jgi:ribosomal protein S18 acetylase RimI-like enzyme